MIVKPVVNSLFLLFVLSAGTFSILGQDKEIDLIDRPITIKMDNQPLGSVFRYLMENYDVQIGFEQSILDRRLPDYNFLTNLPAVVTYKQQSPNGIIKITTTSEVVFKAPLHPITLNVENLKLRKVFDQIVSQMDNYKWKINNGIVNIYPVKERDERFRRLLELHIDRFVLKKGKTVEDITTSIASLPEFHRFMTENKLSFSGVKPGFGYEVKARYGRTIDQEINFSNGTFRDLLNEITKVKKGGWIVKWQGVVKATGREYIDIDI